MDNRVVKVILAIPLPPVGTLLQVGAAKQLWINNVLLFLTFGVGTLTQALWLVLTDQKG